MNQQPKPEVFIHQCEGKSESDFRSELAELFLSAKSLINQRKNQSKMIY